MRRVAILVVIAGSVAALLTGCASDDGTDSTVQIVATTTILGDIARNVAGDNADVEVLMPVGVNPHDFQPSSQQVAAIQRADLVVANGLGLEAGLHDVLEAVESDGVLVWEVAADLDPLLFATADNDEEDGHEDEDGHEHGSLDPHFWLDPLRVAAAAGLMSEHLSEVAPDVDWSAAADEYAAELEALHSQSVEQLAVVSVTDRRLVTNHLSLGYFSDLYGFEMIGTVIPGGASLANPSSAELASLVDIIEREQVPAIFTETIEPDALAQAVAAEVGYDVAVVELYTGSLGESGTDGDTLIGMLTTNVSRIAEALGTP
ncbi:MAG: metal ABC transporter substrate-binding protein [Acidimicrobiia bacterium]